MQIEKIFQGYNVRIEVENDAPLFHLGDVLKAVESKSNPSEIKKNLDSTDLFTKEVSEPGSRGIKRATFINEMALIELLTILRVPKTKDFRRWALREVIPSVLKTGSYSVEPKKPETKLEWMKLAVETEEARLKLEERNKELEPKALAHDHWNDEQEGEMCWRDLSNKIRRYYNLNERTLREHMHAKGDLAKRTWKDDNNVKHTKYVPSTKAIDKGWANEHPKGRYVEYKWSPAYHAELVRRFEAKPERTDVPQEMLFA